MIGIEICINFSTWTDHCFILFGFVYFILSNTNGHPWMTAKIVFERSSISLSNQATIKLILFAESFCFFYTNVIYYYIEKLFQPLKIACWKEKCVRFQWKRISCFKTRLYYSLHICFLIIIVIYLNSWFEEQSVFWNFNIFNWYQ